MSGTVFVLLQQFLHASPDSDPISTPIIPCHISRGIHYPSLRCETFHTSSVNAIIRDWLSRRGLTILSFPSLSTHPDMTDFIFGLLLLF